MGYAIIKSQQLFLSQISKKCSVFTYKEYITSLLKHYSTNQITLLERLKKKKKKLDKCNGWRNNASRETNDKAKENSVIPKMLHFTYPQQIQDARKVRKQKLLIKYFSKIVFTAILKDLI